MRRFIGKILIYASIVAVVILGINGIYMSKAANIDDGSEVHKFTYVPDSIDICNFGSSHGVHSYYYADLEDTYSCFNFALDSQWLSYDERILDYYSHCLHEESVVIIDISYFACYGLAETEYEDFEAKNNRYYSFLPPQYIKEYELFNEV